MHDSSRRFLSKTSFHARNDSTLENRRFQLLSPRISPTGSHRSPSAASLRCAPTQKGFGCHSAAYLTKSNQPTVIDYTVIYASHLITTSSSWILFAEVQKKWTPPRQAKIMGATPNRCRTSQHPSIIKSRTCTDRL